MRSNVLPFRRQVGFRCAAATRARQVCVIVGMSAAGPPSLAHMAPVCRGQSADRVHRTSSISLGRQLLSKNGSSGL
jgi:hypothetical protein